MQEYRVYILGDDGHFVYALPLTCVDDNSAMAQAMLLVDGHDIELWQRARKVATFGHRNLNATEERQS